MENLLWSLWSWASSPSTSQRLGYTLVELTLALRERGADV